MRDTPRVFDRAENVRMLLVGIGAATALWLLLAAAMGAPVWFIVVLAVAWVAGFASGRTDRLTLFGVPPLSWTL